jgi:hypothetical protein
MMGLVSLISRSSSMAGEWLAGSTSEAGCTGESEPFIVMMGMLLGVGALLGSGVLVAGECAGEEGGGCCESWQAVEWEVFI